MFTIWWISSVVIASLSILVLALNVGIGYRDDWVSKDGQDAIRYSSIALMLSPLGVFIIPLLVVGALCWLLMKFVKGIIVFGFSKEVPVDENGKYKTKYVSSYSYY